MVLTLLALVLFIGGQTLGGVVFLVLAFSRFALWHPGHRCWLMDRLYLAEIFLAGFHHRLILRDNLSQSPSGGWQQPPFVAQKGGLPTATTYFKKHKISKGETAAQSLKERFDYGQNPNKTQGGELISSYECDYMTADAEFLLSKAKYKAATGREERRDADVLCYQIRQSFKPGEITPRRQTGWATKRRCAGQRASMPFSSPTHTDRQHIHNHIYYNSTSLDCSHKFRDFIGSARAVRRLSDRVCLENDLSVITSPKLHGKGRFPSITERGWGRSASPPTRHGCGRPSAIPSPKARTALTLFCGSWRSPAMRSSGGVAVRSRSLFRGSSGPPGSARPTLGEGFDPGEIRDVIAGKRPMPKLDAPAPAAPRRVDLIVDIQSGCAPGKARAYERWAKVYNLKQMAAALQFMQEHQISEYDQLTTEAEGCVRPFPCADGTAPTDRG